ncbi:MAG: hypothetical protein V8Q32_06430 [Anaerotignum faecicola]
MPQPGRTPSSPPRCSASVVWHIGCSPKRESAIASLWGISARQWHCEKSFWRKRTISYFHSVLEQPGFIDQLGLTISEFFQYRISPEDTETLAQAEGLSHAAREKLTDLNRIYRSDPDFLRQEYISADETLGLLA